MIVQTPRDPWRSVWQIVTSNYTLAVLLLGIAAGLIVTTWLPQMPAANPAAYARWLSETQARFGDTTPSMQTLGLFTVTRSLGFRALLALLAGSLLLRLIEGGDRLRQHREMIEQAGEWRTLADVRLSDAVDNLRRRRYRILGEHPFFQADHWPWADVFPSLTYSGGLLLLIGLLITHLWGWRIEGQLVPGGERLTLPNTQAWVAWDEQTHTVAHSPGITAFVENQVPGILARADDGTGQPLSIQQTPDTEAVTQLMVALVEDQYFAIPGAQLIVRLAPQPNHTVEPDNPVTVQVYRSPPGRLVDEREVQGEGTISVDDVTLKLTNAPHARLTAVFNPGLWPSSAGLVALAVGLLGNIAWPARRLWLREEDEQIEASGSSLPPLAESREV
ncbi:MAG: hypothetical protein V3R81_03945 [Gammaproteobacteria bacterium]